MIEHENNQVMTNVETIQNCFDYLDLIKASLSINDEWPKLTRYLPEGEIIQIQSDAQVEAMFTYIGVHAINMLSADGHGGELKRFETWK